MPELPEVEAARRAVEEHCCGKRITKAIIGDDDKVIEGVSPAELQKALVGKRVVAAHRKGKNMWLELDTPPFPSFQFGMTGAVYIKGVNVTKYKRSAVNANDEWPSKFSKVYVELDDGIEMSFTDKRRLARVRLLENPEVVPPISELGPDALLELLPEEDLINRLSKKKIAIKGLLLDQSFIAGIGNWIADEVLYQARIHPMQPASALSKESCKSLHKCIKEVIGKALEVGADSSQYPENWIFHSREKKPGKAFVDGKKIDFITVGGRTSAYVPDLQKFDGPIPRNQSVKKEGNRSRKKKDTVESEEEEEEEEAEVGKDETKQGKGRRKPPKTAKAGTTKKGRRKKLDEIGASEQDNVAQADNSGSQQGLEEEESEAKDESASGKKGKMTSKSTKARTKVTVSGEKGKRKTSKKTNEHEASKHMDAKVATKVEQAKGSGKMNHKPNVSEQDEDEKLAKQPKKVGRQQQKAMEKESVEELVPEKNYGKSSDANSAKNKGDQHMPDQVNDPDTTTNTSEKASQGRKRKRGIQGVHILSSSSTPIRGAWLCSLGRSLPSNVIRSSTPPRQSHGLPICSSLSQLLRRLNASQLLPRGMVRGPSGTVFQQAPPNLHVRAGLGLQRAPEFPDSSTSTILQFMHRSSTYSLLQGVLHRSSTYCLLQGVLRPWMLGELPSQPQFLLSPLGGTSRGHCKSLPRNPLVQAILQGTLSDRFLRWTLPFMALRIIMTDSTSYLQCFSLRF